MRQWGPQRVSPDVWRFAIWAPAQAAPALEIAGADPLTLTAQGDGWFAGEAQAGPGTRYRFVLDDGRHVPDPAARLQDDGGVHGWSVLDDPAGHGWRHTGWCGRPWTETVLMEVHAGLAGGFAALAADLPRLADLGITAIELMPLGAFSGSRGWGYDGVLPFAPHGAYGTPDELRALVDAAHGLGLSVFVDVVYNHFGPDGNYLGLYAPDFLDDAVATPWGGAVAVGRPAVAAYFLENALMWLEDYRVDGLRLDAVHAIGDPGFLDDLARRIRAAVDPARRIHLVLENEDNDAARLGPGRYDAQWNDDFHNTMHVLLTGETDAYYANFAHEPTARLARCLAEGFVYQGEPGPEGRTRGTPSAHLPPSAFVGFLQNHDQVGNRALGERLLALADPARLRAATALLLLCPHVPLLFMGEELGAASPFLFFTDFHDDLADAVREGRRREFARFAAFADPHSRALIPDPNDAGTFAASRVVAGPDAPAWQALVRHLIALRREQVVPRLDGARSAGAAVVGPQAVRAAWTMGDGAVLTLLLNLADEAVDLAAAGLGDLGTPVHAEGGAGAPDSLAMWVTGA